MPSSLTEFTVTPGFHLSAVVFCVSLQAPAKSLHHDRALGHAPGLGPTHLGPGQFLLNGSIVGFHVACKLKVVYGVFMATVDFLKEESTQGQVMSQPDLATSMCN